VDWQPFDVIPAKAAGRNEIFHPQSNFMSTCGESPTLTAGVPRTHMIIRTTFQVPSPVRVFSPVVTPLIVSFAHLSQLAAIACEDAELRRLGAFVEEKGGRVYIKVRVSSCSSEEVVNLFQRREAEYTETLWTVSGQNEYLKFISARHPSVGEPRVRMLSVMPNCVRKEHATIPSQAWLAQYKFSRYRSDKVSDAYLDTMMEGSFRAVTLSIEVPPGTCDHTDVVTDCISKLTQLSSALRLPMLIPFPTKSMYWLSVFRGEDYNNCYLKVDFGAQRIVDAVLSLNADEKRRNNWARKYLWDLFCAANFVTAYYEDHEPSDELGDPKMIASLQEARSLFLESSEPVYIPGSDIEEDCDY
jgi:hypothetical protein